MIAEQLSELRAWLGTWGGKLAAVAAGIGTVLADQAAVALGVADYVPEGWPRGVVLLLVAASIFLAPKAAAKKDAANADASQD